LRPTEGRSYVNEEAKEEEVVQPVVKNKKGRKREAEEREMKETKKKARTPTVGGRGSSRSLK
jgi:hypothetical protein